MQLGTLETVGLGWQKADEYVAKVNQVTAEQVRDVARKYLVEDQSEYCLSGTPADQWQQHYRD